MALIKNPENIRLGMIGMTEGNGHPYSWSAIFNRYDREAMTAECPFPGIPAYLNKEDYESMGIAGASVCAVCCDRRCDAEHVAKLSLIPEVVDRPFGKKREKQNDNAKKKPGIGKNAPGTENNFL